MPWLRSAASVAITASSRASAATDSSTSTIRAARARYRPRPGPRRPVRHSRGLRSSDPQALHRQGQFHVPPTIPGPSAHRSACCLIRVPRSSMRPAFSTAGQKLARGHDAQRRVLPARQAPRTPRPGRCACRACGWNQGRMAPEASAPATSLDNWDWRALPPRRSRHEGPDGVGTPPRGPPLAPERRRRARHRRPERPCQEGPGFRNAACPTQAVSRTEVAPTADRRGETGTQPVRDRIADPQPCRRDRMQDDTECRRAQRRHQIVPAKRGAQPSMAFVEQIARGLRAEAAFEPVPIVDPQHEAGRFSSPGMADIRPSMASTVARSADRVGPCVTGAGANTPGRTGRPRFWTTSRAGSTMAAATTSVGPPAA